MRSTHASEVEVGSLPARRGRAIPRGLKLAIVVAVLLRLCSALIQGDVALPLPGVHDQVSYDALARRVLAGHGFSFETDWWPATRAGEPTAHWSYIYTLWLAAIEAVVGPHPLVARFVQAILAGILHPWLAWQLGTRTFGERAGLCAAWLSAVYFYFVYYAGALMTETFTILAILWTLQQAIGLAASDGQSGGSADRRRQGVLAAALPWATLGLAVGLAALLRQVTLLMMPIVVVWLLWARRDPAGRGEPSKPARTAALPTPVATAGWLLVSLAVVIVLILPWTVRNYQAFGRVVLLNTNAGYAFYWANHPIHGTSFIPILPSETYRALIPDELIDLDEASLDAALLRRGLQFVADDPARYISLSVSRTWELFKFWPSADSTVLSNIVRLSSFGIAFPFILVGLVAGWGIVRRGGDCGRAALLLYGYAAAYTLVHLLSWALIRYRLPIDAILLLFAGFALARFWRRPAGGRDVGRALRGN
jgi:hypothetical protein